LGGGAGMPVGDRRHIAELGIPRSRKKYWECSVPFAKKKLIGKCIMAFLDIKLENSSTKYKILFSPTLHCSNVKGQRR
jgi:hypothetical protein